jgi:hypothetical protein
LGWPVVPDVKASSAMSVAAVGQAVNGRSCLRRQRLERVCLAIALLDIEGQDGPAPGVAPGPLQFFQQAASHKAATGCALSMMSPSSLARSSGMVATATRPAFMTASHGQRHADRVAAAQQHPVARHQDPDPHQHLGMAVHAQAACA